MPAPLQAIFPARDHDAIAAYLADMAARGRFTGSAAIEDGGVHCRATFTVTAELEETRAFAQSIATIMAEGRDG